MEARFRCRFCEDKFDVKKTRDIHEFHVHDFRSYHCGQCSLKYCTQSALNKHCASAHAPGATEELTCPKCPLKFNAVFKLRRHLKIHDGKKLYACKICWRRFTQSGSRQRHVLSTHGPNKRLWTCVDCLKPFLHKQNLQIHVRTHHSGAQDFSCPRCIGSFTTQKQLSLHKMQHPTQESALKPRFQCGMNCRPDGYATKSSLAQHLKTTLHSRLADVSKWETTCQEL